MTRGTVALALAPLPVFGLWAAHQTVGVLVALLAGLLLVAAAATLGLHASRPGAAPAEVIDLASRRRPVPSRV